MKKTEKGKHFSHKQKSEKPNKHDSDSCKIHDSDSCKIHDSDSCKIHDSDSCKIHDSDSCKKHDSDSCKKHDSDSCSCSSCPPGPKGPKGDKGDKGDNGNDGAQGPKGDKGDNGNDGAQGPKGDKGNDGAQGPKGDKGDKGDPCPKGDPGISAVYAYIYNTGAQSIANEADLTFSTNGVITSGISHTAGTAAITISSTGDYEVYFSITEGNNQFALFLNNSQVPGTIYGSGTGNNTKQNNGQSIITVTQINSTLTLRNHSTGATVNLSTTDGGTQTIINASILIKKLN